DNLWKRKIRPLMTSDTPTGTYTCREYREEMILLALQKKLAVLNLSPEQKKQILKEIAEAEARMGMD
ncbi:MAG: hypothetical protein LC657_05195, partial [Desulfobacteraceae bacterium]|nr:hypothetical protein [Desulfobacteraceae bacterium]